MKVDKLSVALQLAQRPEGFETNDFADAAGLPRQTGACYISGYRKSGRLVTAKLAGHHDRHFDTVAHRDAWLEKQRKAGPKVPATDPVSLARGAVAFMAGKPFASSVQLKDHLRCEQAQVDAALAPLVDAHKLVRVVAMRDKTSMFDYRLSATWKPQEKDFEICRGASIAPTAHVSPVAPAAPAPLRPDIKVATPATVRESSHRGRDGRTHSDAFEKSMGGSGAALGWAAAAGPAIKELLQPEAAGAEAGSVVDLVDPVFAINSRGQMVIDTEDKGQLRFAIKDTVALYRFLVGASFLERIGQGGAL